MSTSMQRYFTSHRILTALNLSGSNTKSTCIGTCTEGARKGERCGQTLTKGNWDEGLDTLARLDEQDQNNNYLKEWLACAAEKLLCARHHQNQKWDVAEEWSEFKEIRELLLQPSHSTEQSGRTGGSKNPGTAKHNQDSKTPGRRGVFFSAHRDHAGT